MANMKNTRQILLLLAIAGIPAMVIGAHGVGKTSLAYQVWSAIRLKRGQPVPSEKIDVHNARDLAPYNKPKRGEYGLWAFGAHNLSIEEVIGLPSKSKDERDIEILRYLRSTSFLPPEDHVGGGLIVADELNLAGEDIERAMMSLFLEGRFLDYTLPRDVSIITSMNPAAGAYQVRDLNPPTEDRFCMIPLVVEHLEVLGHFQNINVDEDIIDFLTLNGEALNSHQESVMKRVNTKVATSRGYEYVNKVMAVMDSEEQRMSRMAAEIYEGLIGPTAATMLMAHLKNPKRGEVIIKGDEIFSSYVIKENAADGIDFNTVSYADYPFGDKSAEVRRRARFATTSSKVRVDVLHRALKEVANGLTTISHSVRERIGTTAEIEKMPISKLMEEARKTITVNERRQVVNAMFFLLDCPPDMVSEHFLKNVLSTDHMTTTISAICKNGRAAIIEDYTNHTSGKRALARFDLQKDAA